MYICIQVDRKTDFIAGGMILILYLRLYTNSCKYFGVPIRSDGGSQASGGVWCAHLAVCVGFVRAQER